MRTANPTLRAFERPQTWADFQAGGGAPAASLAAARPRTMTFAGTIMATLVLLGLCGTSAVAVWSMLEGGRVALGYPLLLGGLLAALALGLVITAAPRSAPYISPVFALVQGVLVGALSWIVPQIFGIGDGVVIQAMMLTFAILGALLGAYSAGLVRIGSTGVKVITVATAGVMVYYLAGWVLALLGVPILRLGWEGGLIGIGFSLFVVVLASLNLVLDFQSIEAGVDNGAPKHMEWYAGFSLLVTLVWLYIEVLRLLAKIQARD